MIKSNGGSGSVYNCQFNNFMGHTNAYTLDINAYWTDETLAAGNGVEYYDLTFNHWHGTCADGDERAPIQVLCPSEVPCYDITIENGSGPCLNDGSSYTTYTTTYTVTTMR
jgi:rhamnogalacturonan hydrolase